MTLTNSLTGQFAPWPFCSLAFSLPSQFVPWNLRSLALLLAGPFTRGNKSSRELSFCGTFAPKMCRLQLSELVVYGCNRLLCQRVFEVLVAHVSLISYWRRNRFGESTWQRRTLCSIFLRTVTKFFRFLPPCVCSRPTR